MIRVVIFSVLIGIVFFAVQYWGLADIHSAKWEMLLFFFALSFLNHRLIQLGLADNRDKFVPFFLASTVIRFLMSLVFIGLFLYFNVTEPFRFVFTFFALYLFYTSFEIYENNRKLRRDLK